MAGNLTADDILAKAEWEGGIGIVAMEGWIDPSDIEDEELANAWEEFIETARQFQEAEYEIEELIYRKAQEAEEL